MSTAVDYKATVFIPTWFGERYLEELLASVFKQDVPFAYEVLIYDTSSTDTTPDIIKKYQAQHPNLRYKTLTKAEFSHGPTRNDAALDAAGEIVVYLTQDATPAHNRWLYEIVRPFELDKNIVGVMGKQIPRPHAIPLLKSEIKAVFAGFGPDFGTTIFYKDDFIQDQGAYDAVSFYSDVNSAARRSFLVKELPYKNVPYSEDQLFGRDIINAGYHKAYAPRASVVHANDIELKDYRKRMFDETFGLRNVGIPVAIPRLRLIAKLITRGVIRDSLHIIRDREYSWKRKLYWLAFNPLFHIEKWRGVRLGAQAPLDLKDSERSKYSLESAHHHRRSKP